MQSSNEPDIFGETLSELANGPMISNHRALTESLMRRLAEKGWTLEQCAGRKMMNRSIRTLQKHARDFEIAFPDYVPMAMRTKKGKAPEAQQ